MSVGTNIEWTHVGGKKGATWNPVVGCRRKSAGVPFFFKQWGEWSPLAPIGADGSYEFSGQHTMANDGTLYKTDDLIYPDGDRYGEAVRAGHQHASLTSMYRVGKKRAGRELDGRTWDEMPSPVQVATS